MNSLPTLLAKASAALLAGKAPEARELYISALQQHGGNPQAHHNLGIIEAQAGRWEAAVRHFRAALESNPAEGQFWISYIKGLIGAGQRDLAAEALRQGVRQGLSGIEVNRLLKALGLPAGHAHVSKQGELLALVQAGHFAEVIAICSRSLASGEPMAEEAWCALVAAYGALNRHAEAAEAARRGLVNFPHSAQLQCNLGSALIALGQLDAAHAACAAAARLAPKFAGAAYLLGQIEFKRADPDSGLANTQLALALDSRFIAAWIQAGEIHRSLGALTEAQQSFQRAISLEPQSAEAHLGLATVAFQKGDWKTADIACNSALAARPNFVEAQLFLATLRLRLGDYAKVVELCRSVLRAEPRNYSAQRQLASALALLGQYTESLQICNDCWADGQRESWIKTSRAINYFGIGDFQKANEEFIRAEEDEDADSQLGSSRLFFLAYTGFENAENYLKIARQWEQKYIAAEAGNISLQTSWKRESRKKRKLRVGFVSGDFRTHSVASFLLGLLPLHNRDRIEIHAYSASLQEDAVTVRLRSQFKTWVNISDRTDSEATSLIRSHDIDVLVDLSGHTAGNRLGIFALRAAPVQTHYLGYFASTGLTEMDYWIADKIVVPCVNRADFSEKIWHLPRVWISYRGQNEAPPVKIPVGSRNEVYIGSFNNIAKFNDGTAILWSEILKAMPEAKLRLKSRDLCDPEVRGRVLHIFNRLGVDADRVEILEYAKNWEQHMAQYSDLDIALDPIGVVGGGTTTCDALWMGVPVICMAGDRMANRMTHSMLEAIGRAEWVATSAQEYIDKVVSLARDADALRDIRLHQRPRMRASPLYDATGLARALEDAYEGMFDAWHETQVRSWQTERQLASDG